MAKVVTAFTVSNSRGDNALSIVLAVATVGLVLVAVFVLPVFITAHARTHVLSKRFPSDRVFTVFNVSGFVDGVRGSDPHNELKTRGYYGLVAEPETLSIWQGGRSPRRVAQVAMSSVRGARIRPAEGGRSSDLRVDVAVGSGAREIPIKLVHASALGMIPLDRLDTEKFVKLVEATTIAD